MVIRFVDFNFELGLDINHPDFADAFSPKTSFDFNTHGPIKPPTQKIDNHGTRCAGQIVGKLNNGICSVGLAFGSRLSGISYCSSNNSF